MHSNQEQYNISYSDDDDIYLKAIINDDDDDTIMDIRTKDYDNGFRQHDTDVLMDVRVKGNNNISNIVEKSTKDDTNNNKNNDDKKKPHSVVSHELARISSYFFLFGLVFSLSATKESKCIPHRILYFLCNNTFCWFRVGSIIFFKRKWFYRGHGNNSLVVASSPGGSYSNWCCAVFNIDIAISFAMTFVTTVVSIPVDKISRNLMFNGKGDQAMERITSQKLTIHSLIIEK